MDKNTRFLIVDDFSTMRKILKKALGEMGYTQIEEAENGQQAWTMIEQKRAENAPYQFIISDWNMPIMSGVDLLKKFRSDDKNRTTPFVMVTAESEQKQILEAVKMGCSDYIVKPFTPATIKEKIDKVYEKFYKKVG